MNRERGTVIILWDVMVVNDAMTVVAMKPEI